MPPQPSADDLADAIPLGRGRELDARIEAGGCRIRARGAAEDEVDRGEHPLVLEQLDDFDAPGRVEPPSRTTPTGPPRASCLGVEAARLRVWSPVDERGQQVQTVGRTVADEVQVLELDRSALFDDRRSRAAHGAHPVGELVRVAHRRGQAHEARRLRRVDDHLFPDRPAIGVLQVVHLVQDHVAQVAQRVGSCVDHVAQDLGRHHDDRRVAVDRVVAGEQAHFAVPWRRTRSVYFWFDSALIGAV